MVGVSGKWTFKVERTENENMGRWIWVDLGGVIQVIYVYRVSQRATKLVNETMLCKQQVRIMLKRGLKNHNPKKSFLTDLTKSIEKLRDKGKYREIILVADIIEYISSKGDLYNFCQENNVINYIGLLSP